MGKYICDYLKYCKFATAKKDMTMANKTKTKEPEINVGEALVETEQFFTKYKKAIIYTIGVLVVIFAAFLLYKQFVTVPKQNEAVNQAYVAERYFRANEFEMALNGDGNSLGFAQLIQEYGNKAGEAVYFYAGVCELQLGNYNGAISYLEKYKGEDPIISARATACIGDAYVGLNDYNSAVSRFIQAAKVADNILAASYLMKAGLVYEELGQNEQALNMYEEIKLKYPQSAEGYEIDKYITRIKSL